MRPLLLIGVQIQIGRHFHRVITVKVFNCEIFAGRTHHQPMDIVPNLGLGAKIAAKGIRKIRFLPAHAD